MVRVTSIEDQAEELTRLLKEGDGLLLDPVGEAPVPEAPEDSRGKRIVRPEEVVCPACNLVLHRRRADPETGLCRECG